MLLKKSLLFDTNLTFLVFNIYPFAITNILQVVSDWLKKIYPLILLMIHSKNIHFLYTYISNIIKPHPHAKCFRFVFNNKIN